MRRYYLADGLGSVVGLADAAGALSRSYKYDPYGLIRSTTGTTPNPFQFTGAYRETHGSLYKIGARYYQPDLGRWTQQDPLDQAGDLREGNRYAYVGGDPVNLIDPTGTSVFDGVAEAFDDVVDAVQDDARDVQQVWNDARSFLRSAGGRLARNCIIGGGIGFSVASIAKQSAKRVPLVIGGCAVVNIVRRGR